MKNCKYCNKDLTVTNYNYHIIRKAIKPPKWALRFVQDGYCCTTCKEAGQPTTIDEYPR